MLSCNCKSNGYGWCDVGDRVLPKFGTYVNDVCEVVKIDGAYIYIHPIDEDEECVLEVYLNEVDLYEKYSEVRERKINEILKEK